MYLQLKISVILILAALEPDVNKVKIDPEKTGLYVAVPQGSEEIPWLVAPEVSTKSKKKEYDYAVSKYVFKIFG